MPELIPFDSRARKALELEDGAGMLAGLGVDKGAAEANITAAVAAALAAQEQS